MQDSQGNDSHPQQAAGKEQGSPYVKRLKNQNEEERIGQGLRKQGKRFKRRNEQVEEIQQEEKQESKSAVKMPDLRKNPNNDRTESKED